MRARSSRMRAGRRWLVGDAVSGFGDWFTYIGVAALAVGQVQRELALVAVVLAALPRVLLAPIAGALADRIDRRTLLIVATLLRGACAAAMAASAFAGALWAVHAWHALRMALGAITDAASRAMLPRLVPARELPRANALAGVSYNGTFVAGVAAGGAVTAFAGAGVAFAIDALSFVLAAAIYTGLPAMTIAVVRTRAKLARPMLAKVPAAIATGAGWIALSEAAGRAASVALALGSLHVARAIGAGVAPLVWRRGVRAATAVTIAAVALFGLWPSPAIALAWGCGVGATWVTATTRLQASVPDAQLGRASAIDVVAQTLAQCAGGVLAAAIVAAGGSGAQACGAGALIALVAWAVLG